MQPSMKRIDRRDFAAALGALALAPAVLAKSESGPLVEVWKSPDCGCCKDWIAHLEASGSTAIMLPTMFAIART